VISGSREFARETFGRPARGCDARGWPHEARQLRDDVEIVPALRRALSGTEPTPVKVIVDLAAGRDADEVGRRSADQPDRALAHLDRECLQRSSAGRRLHSARERLERALRPLGWVVTAKDLPALCGGRAR
jgi:hypothetical protein